MNLKRLKEILKERKLVAALITLIAAVIVSVSASIPVLEGYTIATVEVVNGKEVCTPISSEIDTHILTLFEIFIGEVFEPLPEVTETP